jgi:hypothetical protein
MLFVLSHNMEVEKESDMCGDTLGIFSGCIQEPFATLSSKEQKYQTVCMTLTEQAWRHGADLSNRVQTSTFHIIMEVTIYSVDQNMKVVLRPQRWDHRSKI